MMTGAAAKTSTATRSAAGGAGGLFSCYDFYSQFEGLTKVHARMVGAGATLNKAVRNALRETIQTCMARLLNMCTARLDQGRS